MSDQPTPPDAEVKKRTGFSFIWFLPIVAMLVGGYLAFTTLAARGPDIVITFRSADGLTTGQTHVKHKNVDLGTVASIRLSPDMTHVVVLVHMTAEAQPYLTDQARFWVVRPRLTPGNISGLDTIISGAFIELDPGTKEGEKKRDYAGLEDPPGVRSGEPGRTFVLDAPRIGSIGTGSPVFFRDITVGEVLGYNLPDGVGPITVNVFVREPFDKRVRTHTQFWNASGLRVDFGGSGIHVQIESLKAVVSGGVAFSTPEEAEDSPRAEADATFPLFEDEETANAAGFKQRIPLVSYFTSPAAGLVKGAPVQIYGIQVGTVTDVQLQVDPVAATARVRVAMEVQPERLTAVGGKPGDSVAAVTQRLVDHGMRATLATSNYLTGSQVVAFDFTSNPAPAVIAQEGDAIVLPSMGGGFAGLTTAMSNILAKVDTIPFAQIGTNANALIGSVNALVSGPEIKRTLGTTSEAMIEVQGLVKHADAGLQPLLKRLPEISNDAAQAVARANHLVGSVDTGYGSNSQFSRDLERLMAQLNDTARSIRLLADFLDRHPESLIRGRTAQGAER